MQSPSRNLNPTPMVSNMDSMYVSESKNYYRMSLRSAADFTDFKTMSINDALVVMGRLDGKWRVQSVLFSKRTHTAVTAKIRSFYYKNIF